MLRGRGLLFAGSWIGLILCAGCAVPQPRGDGLHRRLQEPRTKAWYHLYLPVDYIRNRGRHPDPKVKRWPLVMTFHGMKPYDSAPAQEKEWEKEADVYGYIVCAPELHTCDSFMEYPLTKEHDYVLRDKRNVLAIMDRIFATTAADPKRVLSTSWSCGGYLAHYFPNRFPDRFSCIATRLSNFSPELMIEETVPLYREKTAVAVFIGDGDFPACKTESEEAVAWYTARKFRLVRGKMIDNMGHRRIPQVAAAFFAEQLGIEPLRPLQAQTTLARVRMTDYNPTQELIARLTPRTPVRRDGARIVRTRPGATGQRTGVVPRIPRQRKVVFECKTPGRNYPFGQTPAYDPTPEQDRARGRARTPPATPATGATQLARGSRSGSDWLAPPGGGNRSSERPSGRDRPRGGAAKTGSVGRRTRAEASPGPGRTAGTSRSFKPLDAGPRDYDRSARRGTTRNEASLARAAGQDSPDRKAVRRAPTARAPARPKPQGGTARRVNVRLSGPAVGTAPHYIAYSVELSRSILDGADCLWMDNGVWIGDEPRGVKIIESPGLHRITVLIVTQDDVEYRGSAAVHVLEPARSRSSRRMGTH